MERRDLGELFARITRRLVDAERPLLEAHGLTMWGYTVLSQLARETAATQLALARTIDYDKTRLIRLLDKLEDAGLLSRQPDPADRRAHIVRLTPYGRKRLTAARAAIRDMEAELLGDMRAGDQEKLIATLTGLAGVSDDARADTGQ